MDPKYPEKGPSGRCPGVVEEALLICLTNKPLYLSALLGGVTEQVINAILGRDASLDFELPKPVLGAYAGMKFNEKPNLAANITPTNLREIYDYDGPLTSGEILGIFRKYGVERLSLNNGLSQQENGYLFDAATIDEVIGWVLTGLARLRGREEANTSK